MNATIEELSKIFECEPDYHGLENEKPYIFVSFKKEIKDISVSLKIIAPIGEFQLKARRNEELFFDFRSQTSSVVKAEIFEDKHLLIIESGETTKTFIRIKPDFFVGHEIKEY